MVKLARFVIIERPLVAPVRNRRWGRAAPKRLLLLGLLGLLLLGLHSGRGLALVMDRVGRSLRCKETVVLRGENAKVVSRALGHFLGLHFLLHCGRDSRGKFVALDFGFLVLKGKEGKGLS